MKEYFDNLIPKIEESIKTFFLKEGNKQELKNILIGKELWEKIIQKPFTDLFERGGKRIRPILGHLTYEAFGGQNDIIKYITIPEIIHTGTVIIDDIQDHSGLRRGGPTIHTIYGENIAINNGNFLYFYPQLILKYGDLPNEQKLKIFEEIATQMTNIHLGQGMDICRSESKNFDISIQDYLQMCAYKTGTLLSLSIQMGAILANVDSDKIEKLGKIGETIGTAFQIKDDILNLKPADGWGKQSGEDITEGKLTYMVIDTLQNASENDSLLLKKILTSGTKEITDIESAISIMDKYNSFENAHEYMQKIIDDAKLTLQEIMPDTKYRSIYIQILDYLINRKK